MPDLAGFLFWKEEVNHSSLVSALHSGTQRARPTGPTHTGDFFLIKQLDKQAFSTHCRFSFCLNTSHYFGRGLVGGSERSHTPVFVLKGSHVLFCVLGTVGELEA